MKNQSDEAVKVTEVEEDWRTRRRMSMRMINDDYRVSLNYKVDGMTRRS